MFDWVPRDVGDYSGGADGGVRGVRLHHILTRSGLE